MTKKFRPQTARVSVDLFRALLTRVLNAPSIIDARYPGTTFVMLDDEFRPTQDVNALRWMAWANGHDCALFKVDNAGTITRLVKEE